MADSSDADSVVVHFGGNGVWSGKEGVKKKGVRNGEDKGIHGVQWV